MEAKFNFREICQLIFSLDTKNSAIPSDLSEDTKKFIISLTNNFPNDSLAHLISKELKNEKYQTRELLVDYLNHTYFFPLSSIILDKILEDKNLFVHNGVFEIFSSYVFYTFISTILLFFKNQKYNFTVLLSILNYIMKISKNDQKKNRYYIISISCFIHTAQIAVEKHAIVEYIYFFEVLHDFYFENKNLPSNSDVIIKTLSSYMLTSDDTLSDNSALLLNLASMILIKSPNVLNQSTILLIIDLTKNLIANLNKFCLMFFLNAAKHIKIEDFIHIFKPIIAQALTSVISFHNENKEDKQIQNDNIKTITNNNDSDYFHPPSNLYQINNIDDSNITTSISVQELSCFINPKLLEILIIIKSIITLKIEYAEYFLSEANEYLLNFDTNIALFGNISIFYEQCASLFFLISETIKTFSKITIPFLKSLFNSKHIFDPRVTYFTQDSNFEIINSLRNYIFHFLMEKRPILLNEILKENNVYADLFHECICRIIDLKNNEKNLDFYPIANTLITSLTNYRLNPNSTDLNNDEIQNLIIRKSLLLCLNSFLSNDCFLISSFSSPAFISHFFIQFFEPPIRQKFIGFLQRYLSSLEKTENNSVLHLITENLIQLSEKASKELPTNESFSLFSDILNAFNEAMIVNHSICNSLTPVSTCIYNIIMKIGTFDGQEELFLSLLIFLSETSNSKDEISLLESKITQLFANKSQSKVMQMITELIGRNKNSISNYFEIKNSKVLCSLVRIFKRTNIICDIFKFISDLCSYSYTNCIKCNAGELDVLILDEIEKLRTNKTTLTFKNNETDLKSNRAIESKDKIDERGEKINEKEGKIIESDESIVHTDDCAIDNDNDNKIIVLNDNNESADANLIDLQLHLFSQIASIASSSDIIRRFFAILCPIENQYLSPIHKEVLGALKKLLINSKSYPSASLPMLPSNEIRIHSIPSEPFSQGFTFGFWISMPPATSGLIQNIIVLDDGQKHKFKVKLIENFLRVKIQSENAVCQSDFYLFFENNSSRSWTMIAITATSSSDDQETALTIQMNKQIIEKILNVPLFSPKEAVECVVNQSKKVSKIVKNDPPLISLFFLSKPLQSYEIKLLVIEGPRLAPSFPEEKCIFSYEIRRCIEFLSLKTLRKIEGITENYQNIVCNRKITSFADWLIDNNFSLVLPIFDQIDIQFTNGMKNEIIKDIQYEILFNLLNFGDEVQQIFYNYHFFEIISHFIQKSNKSNLTYKLYMLYFNLIEIITNKNLQIQLIDSILMNVDLWQKSNVIQKVKIFNHWNKNLYDRYQNIIDQIRPIEWYLFIINNYLYKSNEAKKELYYECRVSLFEIVRKSIQSNFNSNQVPIILSLIARNESTLVEKKEMINFLTFIIQKKTVVINSNVDISQIISNILQILNLPDKDDEIIGQIFYLFIIIYKANCYETKTPLFKLIQIIIKSLHIDQNYFFQENMFSNLISIMNANKAIDFLPILCINTIYGGSKYLKILLTMIYRKVDYYIIEQSTIYPSLLLFVFYPNNYLYNKIIKVILDLFRNNWKKLIDSINIIGHSCFDSNLFDNVKHDVLLFIAKKFIQKPEEAFYMIRMIKDFIFFRPKKSKSSILSHIIKSDTYEKIKQEQVNNLAITEFDSSESSLEYISSFSSEFNTFNDETKEVIQNMSEMISKNEFEWKFGLRFNETDDNWLDLDLAKKTFSIYQKFNAVQYSELMIILGRFIYKCDPSFINKISMLLESTNKCIFPDLKLLENSEINNLSIYSRIESFLTEHDDGLSHSIMLCANEFISYYKSVSFLENKDDSVHLKAVFEMSKADFADELTSKRNQNETFWLNARNSLISSQSVWSDWLVSKEHSKSEKKELFTKNYFIGEDDEKYHKIIKRIGEGLTSIVYKIIDTRTQKVMCKKVLKIVEGETQFKDLQNAIKEFNVLFSIDHPCICHAYGINTAEIIEEVNDGEPITTVSIFLEYFEMNFKNCLSNNLLKNTLKVKIVLEIAHGMSFLHKLGMIHRDLKIDNIMLDTNYNAKLIDFGLVKINECLFNKYSFVESSMTKGVGTLAFMSPEMLNEEDYDYKTDVYSFGVILYYVFVGDLPKYTMKDKLLGKPINFPNSSPSISHFCIDLITRCLHKDSNQRPSFDEILNDLRNNSYLLADDIDQSIIKQRDDELNIIESSYFL